MGRSEVTITTYTCDRCGVQSSVPFPLNGRVRVTHDLLDYQGAAVGGSDRTLDLCRPCLSAVIDIITPTGEARSA